MPWIANSTYYAIGLASMFIASDSVTRICGFGIFMMGIAITVLLIIFGKDFHEGS